MGEGKEYKLGDVLTIKYGKDHKQLADGDIPIYGSGGIMRYGERSLYDGPSILIPRKGSLNNVMYADKPFWTVDTMFWSIINEDIANPLFVFYSICKKDFASLNVGSAVPSLTVPVIEDIDILLPSKTIQDKIVTILKSLDDKIEVNRRINENLEQQAQALFKSWFVDFEPFKNGEFVESELGMIPKGWRVGRLGEYCRVRSGFAFKSTWWTNDGVPVIKIKNITDNGNLEMLDCSFVSKEHAALATEFQTLEGDLLIAMTGATIGKFCIVHDNREYCVNQRVGKFFLGNEPLKKLPFIYLNLKQPSVHEEIINRGQGSAQPNISGGDIETLRVVLAPDFVINKFNVMMYPLFKKVISNNQESRRLASLRDTLLPKLMSGELNVNEVNNL